jgi:hypothetical protein
MAKIPKKYQIEFAKTGGKARARSLTPERRKEIARKAVNARWAKAKREKAEK